MSKELLKTYSDEELSAYLDKLRKRLRAQRHSESFLLGRASHASGRVEVTRNLLHSVRDEQVSRSENFIPSHLQQPRGDGSLTGESR